jgi:hypothetical protein
MKKITQLLEYTSMALNDDITLVRNEAIETIKDILKRNPDIDITLINSVGIVESGSLQFKIASSIKNRQVILLLGYLKWFWEISDGELK